MGIPIPIRTNYQYKDYPEDLGLSALSRGVGFLTGGGTYLAFVCLLVWASLFNLLNDQGLPGWLSMVIALVAAIAGVPILFKWIRTIVFKKLDDMYMKKLQKWQQTDPQRYVRAVQELQKGQNKK